jgi:hypothetical protein
MSESIVKRNNKSRIVLTAALAGSAVIGLWIIATDAWLWSVAPEHALGLIAFVGFDAILAAALWKMVRPATLATVVFAGIQLVAMAGDLVFYRPLGVASEVWVGYLLGNLSFMSLLVLQVAIIGIAAGAVATRVLRPLREA